MRRLAASLSVDPMALYHHVPGKPALVSALIAEVFGRLEAPALPRASWKAKVRAFARAYRGLALSHPGLVLAIVSDGEAAGRASLVAGESLYAALEASGLGPARVVIAADTVVDYLHGVALAERGGALDGSAARDALPCRLTGGGSRHPALERTRARLPARGFEAGLEVILLGIEALESRPRRRGRGKVGRP
jgi:AcrR family transcriptional regulator